MDNDNKIGTDAIKDTVKAFDQEEILEAIKVVSDDILWDELIRRDAAIFKKINCIKDILGVTFDNLYYIPASVWSDIRTKYNDLRDKFSELEREVLSDY